MWIAYTETNNTLSGEDIKNDVLECLETGIRWIQYEDGDYGQVDGDGNDIGEVLSKWSEPQRHQAIDRWFLNQWAETYQQVD